MTMDLDWTSREKNCLDGHRYKLVKKTKISIKSLQHTRLHKIK